MTRVLPFVLLFACAGAAAAQRPYYPPAGAAWEERRPEQLGMDAALLAEAVAFAQASDATAPRDLELAHYQTFGREPLGFAVGPFQPRGAATGLVVRRGYVVARWGEPARVDMTFSVTKSFVSSVVGLAWDRGLIPDLDARVADAMGPVLPAEPSRLAAEASLSPLGSSTPLRLFESEHNRAITWQHLLRQTSAWQGTLWGKPDWADRPASDAAGWLTEVPPAAGSVYEYNDTRVNLLALAALNVWRRPLPQVLREHLMDPIGASRTWRWYGYDNSWIVLDGERVQSVSGGGHWGGGMFISAWDMARFGLLTLRDGLWQEQQVVSREWLRLARTPTPAQPTYGFMNFFLNTERQRLPSAPETAFMHVGAGSNIIYCDPVNDLVIVARWIQGDAVDGLVQRVLASLR
jgi:CubicO group peptidase (beta-lactamase class C family)